MARTTEPSLLGDAVLGGVVVGPQGGDVSRRVVVGLPGDQWSCSSKQEEEEEIRRSHGTAAIIETKMEKVRGKTELL